MKTLILALSLAIVLVLPLPSFAQQEWNLKQCIDYALENNLFLKQQEAIRDQNVIALKMAKNSRLPNLNSSIGQSFDFGRGLTVDNTYANRNTQNSSFSLSTNIPLFTGLQIPNNIVICRLNLQAAIEDLDKAKNDIGIQISSIYLQILFNKELLDVANQQVKLSGELLELKKAFFDSGRTTNIEYNEALSRLAQDKMSSVQADNNYRLSLLDLCQFLEISSVESFDIIYNIIIPEFTKISTPEDIYETAVLEKPEIKAAYHRAEGALKNISLIRSGLYPKLNLNAGIGTNYYNVSGIDNPSFNNQWHQNFNKHISLSLSIPLFNRFETRNRINNAKIQYSIMNLKLENAKKNLLKEIQQAYYNATASESKIESCVVTVNALKATFNLVSEQYAVGKVTATVYNEARLNWMRASSDMIQAKYEYLFRTKILDFYNGIPISL